MYHVPREGSFSRDIEPGITLKCEYDQSVATFSIVDKESGDIMSRLTVTRTQFQKVMDFVQWTEEQCWDWTVNDPEADDAAVG